MPFRRAFATALFLQWMGLSAAAADPGVPNGQGIEATRILVAQLGRVAPHEHEALSFRHLQTELMVAALSCGQPTYRTKYNAFIVRFRPQLKRNARTLRAMFARTYGTQSKRRLDDYITKLANEFSIRSMVRSDFCPLAGRKLSAVLRLGHGESAGALLQQADRF